MEPYIGTGLELVTIMLWLLAGAFVSTKPCQNIMYLTSVGPIVSFLWNVLKRLCRFFVA
ncbi:MAG: hypothetical protein G01um101491_193 [Parcubacteria group bacterium Gr01-1014_91]|nr:MAG: hypothetical protein G01um101491_193 [Parcubacteria group bacterium Gr01-1014_91]